MPPPIGARWYRADGSWCSCRLRRIVSRFGRRNGDPRSDRMQDFLYVSFFLGHKKGKDARRLLRACDLLEVALADRANRHSWLSDLHFGVSVRLPVEDHRLNVLLDRLRECGVAPFTRVDREYSRLELDAADWLMLRVATAGLYGGVDYNQAYTFRRACVTCGAGAEPIPPLIAELGKMGKKDLDHLVYEGHLVASSRIVRKLAGLSGLEVIGVRSPRRPPDPRFSWLRITGAFPKMHSSTTGIATENLCPACGRAGHFGIAIEPEVPIYERAPRPACDVNHTWEYFGDWQQVRGTSQVRRVGGSRGIIVSKRGRRMLQALRVRHLVWVPIIVLERN
jgi:hypothetical protein